MHIIFPTVLIILDGFGYSKNHSYNAIAQGKLPHFNALLSAYPHTFLSAAGSAVGLPDYMNGNSEVGHFTIGAGRIIDQPMKRWLQSIEDGTFFANAILLLHLHQLRNTNGALHIMGLLSDAGVHCHEKQVHSLIHIAVKEGIKKIVIHPFLDGRDVAPRSAYNYLQRLTQLIHQFPYNQVFIGSIHGRFYAMDRDHNWDRIEKSYRVLTEKQNDSSVSWEKVLEYSYNQGITDEFIEPMQLNPEGIIGNGDGILFCNIRPDRARELTASFLLPQQNNFHHFMVKPLALSFFITPVIYDISLPTIPLFNPVKISNTLKDILSQQGKTIFSIAETEKYAHVTYFFHGENEEPVATETQMLIPSLKVKTYKDFPEMKANEITAAVIRSLNKKMCDFYLINYANADMVGHSGDFDATIQAVECLDKQIGIMYTEFVEKRNGTLYITADHGKAEAMFDEELQQPRTGHTNNKVPFIVVQKKLKNSFTVLPLQQLSDIAPFIVEGMVADNNNKRDN